MLRVNKRLILGGGGPKILIRGKSQLSTNDPIPSFYKSVLTNYHFLVKSVDSVN